MSGTLQFLNPRGTIAANHSKLAPLVASLAGTTGGFRVQWPSFDIFMHRIQELLQERQVKQIHTLYTGSDGTAAGKVTIRGRSDAVSWDRAYDEFAEKVDWGILGLAA